MIDVFSRRYSNLPILGYSLTRALIGLMRSSQSDMIVGEDNIVRF